MKKILFALTCLLLFQCLGCKIGDDGSQPVRQYYAFEQTVKIESVNKEYQVNDIIWLDIKIPNKEMVDATTGKTVKVGNARFVPVLDLYDPFAGANTDDKFVLFPNTGEVVEDKDFQDGGNALLAFGCPESSYSLRVGIQLKKEGGYFLTFHKSSPVLQFFFTESSDCSIQDVFPPPAEASIGSVVFKLDAADTNKDKMEEYAAGFPAFTGNLATIREALDNKTAFFVRVK